MTKQEIFDVVVTHLRKQGKQARLGSGRCAYRAPDGCKCAVGCLFTDDEYQPIMDSVGNTVYELRAMELLPERLIPHVDFLTALQELHDLYSPEKWEVEFFLFAKKHNLKLLPKAA